MRGILSRIRATTDDSMSGLRVGSWTLIIALLSLLAVTSVAVYVGWTLGQDAVVPTSGYVAMTLGVTISLCVGFGLMALIFYSSRNGYDQPPVIIARTDDIEESESKREDTDKIHPLIGQSLAWFKATHCAVLGRQAMI
jgi:hypothetical protein